MIPYSRQSISKEDISSVTRVLKSNFLTKGPLVKEFERKISKKFLSKYVVSSNSGSSSLHLACLAIGIKKGDIVWTAPITYAASANCAINCGATIDFIDICDQTFNISVVDLKKKLEIAKKKNLLPKAIIPVHLEVSHTNKKKSGNFQGGIILKSLRMLHMQLGQNIMEKM